MASPAHSRGMRKGQCKLGRGNHSGPNQVRMQPEDKKAALLVEGSGRGVCWLRAETRASSTTSPRLSSAAWMCWSRVHVRGPPALCLTSPFERSEAPFGDVLCAGDQQAAPSPENARTARPHAQAGFQRVRSIRKRSPISRNAFSRSRKDRRPKLRAPSHPFAAIDGSGIFQRPAPLVCQAIPYSHRQLNAAIIK
jgi:hypothetical protein